MTKRLVKNASVSSFSQVQPNLNLIEMLERFVQHHLGSLKTEITFFFFFSGEAFYGAEAYFWQVSLFLFFLS